MGNYILCHHGIRGQRWGIRRFQNEDGSLTEAGKKRYLDSSSKEYYNESSKRAIKDIKEGKFDQTPYTQKWNADGPVSINYSTSSNMLNRPLKQITKAVRAMKKSNPQDTELYRDAMKEGIKMAQALHSQGWSASFDEPELQLLVDKKNVRIAQSNIKKEIDREPTYAETNYYLSEMANAHFDRAAALVDKYSQATP